MIGSKPIYFFREATSFRQPLRFMQSKRKLYSKYTVLTEQKKFFLEIWCGIGIGKQGSVIFIEEHYDRVTG